MGGLRRDKSACVKISTDKSAKAGKKYLTRKKVIIPLKNKTAIKYLLKKELEKKRRIRNIMLTFHVYAMGGSTEEKPSSSSGRRTRG